MVVSCCAVGCTNRFIKGCGITFHTFPVDENRKVRWILALKRKNWKPTEHSRVCGVHFQTGKPSRDKDHPDFVPNVFSYSKGKCRSAQKYEAHKKRNEKILLAKRKKIWLQKTGQACEAGCKSQSQIVISEPVEKTTANSSNNLKSPDIKIDNVLSLQPSVLEHVEDTVNSSNYFESQYIAIDNDLSLHPSISVFEQVKKIDIEQRLAIDNFLLEDCKLLTAGTPIRLMSNAVSSQLNYSSANSSNKEKENPDHQKRKQPTHQLTEADNEIVSEVDIIPKTENDSSAEETDEMLLETDSDSHNFPCNKNNSKSLSSEEILQQKLDTMTALYKKSQKRLKLCQEQCKHYAKQVIALEDVIDNLKLINSVSELS